MTEKTKPKPKTKSKPKNKPKRENKTDAEDATERAIKFEAAVKSGGGRLSWVVLALVIVGAAILVYASGFKLDDVAKLSQKSEDQLAGGTPTIGGPFTLVDQDGKTVTDKDFRGQYLVIYFGYTYCPDVCPTALQSITQAMDRLNVETQKRITPIFITIDPERDTARQLNAYVENFHPNLVGLTGTAEEIAKTARIYRVYFGRAKDAVEESTDYLVDHSSIVFLMNPNGKYVTHFTHTTPPRKIAERLAKVVGS